MVRAPGSVNGEQLMISHCEDSVIIVLDHTATVTIDDCMRCRLFIGPTRGRHISTPTHSAVTYRSVFIRDCADCDVLVPCQQFRCARVECKHV